MLYKPYFRPIINQIYDWPLVNLGLRDPNFLFFVLPGLGSPGSGIPDTGIAWRMVLKYPWLGGCYAMMVWWVSHGIHFGYVSMGIWVCMCPWYEVWTAARCLHATPRMISSQTSAKPFTSAIYRSK